jgi:ubiquinone/menaquinone biosynthesis C-methylase UbiE
MEAVANDSTRAYNSPEVVERYADAADLMPAEEVLFRRYLRTGMDILDIGVGAGRTTAGLRSLAGRYVGVDYAEAMVEACRRRFPDLEFVQADAADLSAFPDASFDAVIFSFNGVDCLPGDDRRHLFLQEAHRVLRPAGVLILSRHNARSLFIVPLEPRQGGLKARLGWLKYAALENVWRLRAVPTQPPFWRGDGAFQDHADNGIELRVASRRRAIEELESHDFTLLDVVGSNHPLRLPSAATPWWYYACMKRERQASAVPTTS